MGILKGFTPKDGSKKDEGKKVVALPLPSEPIHQPAAPPAASQTARAPVAQAQVPAEPGPVPFDFSVPDTKIYEREREESKRFESEAHILLRGTVPSIGFGEILTMESPAQGTVETKESDPCGDSGHQKGYVMGLGRSPSHKRGGLSLVKESSDEDEGDNVYSQLIDSQDVDGEGNLVHIPGAAPSLEKHSLHVQEGPYADKDGLVARFADAIFEGVKRDDLFALIERIIDIRPFMAPQHEVVFPKRFKPPVPYNFKYSMDYMPPDSLPAAGEILSQNGRLNKNKVTKAVEFELVHPLEPYILAVAALRLRGYPAYPAFALIPGSDGESLEPLGLIAILDMKQKIPLTTFDLKRGHPGMGAMDIMSDVAVMGALHAMRAESRVKHLAAEMVEQSKAGKELSPEEVGLQLKRIARSLFESVKRWDGNPFIPKTTSVLHGMAGQAILESDINRHRNVNGPEVADRINTVVENMLRQGINPAQVQTDDPFVQAAREVVLDVLNIQHSFVEQVQVVLGRYISDAKLEKTG
jgi:hypothetical protein